VFRNTNDRCDPITQHSKTQHSKTQQPSLELLDDGRQPPEDLQHSKTQQPSLELLDDGRQPPEDLQHGKTQQSSLELQDDGRQPPEDLQHGKTQQPLLDDDHEPPKDLQQVNAQHQQPSEESQQPTKAEIEMDARIQKAKIKRYDAFELLKKKKDLYTGNPSAFFENPVGLTSHARSLHATFEKANSKQMPFHKINLHKNSPLLQSTKYRRAMMDRCCPGWREMGSKPESHERRVRDYERHGQILDQIQAVEPGFLLTICAFLSEDEYDFFIPSFIRKLTLYLQLTVYWQEFTYLPKKFTNTSRGKNILRGSKKYSTLSGRLWRETTTRTRY
jgi:hypothetical protein